MNKDIEIALAIFFAFAGIILMTVFAILQWKNPAPQKSRTSEKSPVLLSVLFVLFIVLASAGFVIALMGIILHPIFVVLGIALCVVSIIIVVVLNKTIGSFDEKATEGQNSHAVSYQNQSSEMTVDEIISKYSCTSANNIKTTSTSSYESAIKSSKIASQRSAHNYDFVVLDFETTGLSPSKDFIIQVGAVKYNHNVRCDSFSKYIKPPISIPHYITELTGIDDSTVKCSPSIDIVLPDLLKFIGNFPIVCHNAAFDISFLIYAAKKHNINLPDNYVIDTLSLSKKCIKDVSDHRLITLKNYLKLNLPSHDALSDCLTTGELFNYCSSLEPEINKKTIHMYMPDKFRDCSGKGTSPISEITEKEIAYYRSLIKILQSFSADTSEIVCLKKNSKFTILDAYPIVTFVFKPKLNYWLVEYPLEELTNVAPEKIICTPASKSEGPRANRVFLTAPEDLFLFKRQIKELYTESQQKKETYYKYFKKERYFDGQFRISNDVL